MAVTLGERALGRYERFSLFNSPYPAHDEGCAIDLYPGTLRDGRTTAAPSPVAGTVTATRTVRAPPKPYAPEHDHLVVIDVDEPAGVAGTVARILHVDPAVEAGDRVAIGDSLGALVRAGFFAPWVDNHLHVGFREPGRDPYRASGSLPISLGADVDLRPLRWDGAGTVVETGEAYAALDSPRHPDPGSAWVGIAADGGGVLDGGLPHYAGGGLLGLDGAPEGGEPGEGASEGVEVSLDGDRLGVANGRTVTWDDVTVLANDEPVTGLSFFCARDGEFGLKIVCPERPLAVGDDVRVSIERK